MSNLPSETQDHVRAAIRDEFTTTTSRLDLWKVLRSLHISFSAPVGVCGVLSLLVLWEAEEAFSQVGFYFWSVVFTAMGVIYLLTAFTLLVAPTAQTPAALRAVISYCLGIGVIQSVILTLLGAVTVLGAITVQPSFACFLWGSIELAVFGPSARALFRRFQTLSNQ